MTRLVGGFVLLLVVALAVSCGGGKAAATRALGEAEAAYSRISVEAASLAPEQAAELEAALVSARAALASGEHAAALETARGLLDRIDTLAQSLPGLRERLDADWKTLSESVPGALAALDRKLQDSGPPLEGMPGRAPFEKASAELEDARARWAEAQALSSTGLAKAVAMAEQVRLDAVRVLTEYGQRGS